MLVSDIATRVKRQFGDEVGAQIRDDDIIRWINDAMTEIAINNDLLQVAATANTTVGQPDYRMPDTVLTMRSVKYNGIKLQGISPEEADQSGVSSSAAQGTPTQFSRYAAVLTLYPVPDSVQVLTMFFTRNPVQVTAVGDTPELDLQYHNRIVEYCVAQAAESDDNLTHHQLKMGQFKSGIDALKDNSTWMEQDFYPSITVSPHDMYMDSESSSL